MMMISRLSRLRAAWVVVAALLACGSMAFGAVADHVTQIVIIQTRVYEDPADTDPSHNFLLSVETDDTVDHITFRSGAGNDFTIPADEQTQTGDVYTSHTDNNGTHRWVYGGTFTEASALNVYGDGNYTVTVHYTAGGTDATTVYYGMEIPPFIKVPFPWPNERPTLTYPQQMASVASPVTFTWQPAGNILNTPAIVLLIQSKLGRQAPEPAPMLGDAVQSDPIDLDPGLWLTQLAFGSLGQRDNDGVPVILSKSVASAYEFAVNTGPTTTIEVGGERYSYIHVPREIDEMAVELTAGQELVVDVEAMSIGSELDPEIVVTGPGGELARGNDGADMGQVTGLEMELRGSRAGNAGAPEGQATVVARSRDPRVYFTVPFTGSYTVAIGDRAAVQGTGDGASGKMAHYCVRVLPAADLPAADLANTVVTLTTPAGVETLTYGTDATGEDGYFLDAQDAEAAILQRFPDGDYTLRAEPPSGDPAERPFTVGGAWPAFPQIDQPADGATGVAEPVHVAWQPIADADTTWVGLRRAGPNEQGIAEGQWDATGQTTLDIPAAATAVAQTFAVAVEGRAAATEPFVEVAKARETHVVVQLVRDQPGGLLADMAPRRDGAINPDGPAQGSLHVIRLETGANAADTVYAIRGETGWLCLDTIAGHARADGAAPEWRPATDWRSFRHRGLAAAALCIFLARARDAAAKHSDLEQVGAYVTNRPGDVDRSGLATSLDYALARAAILRALFVWPGDVNDSATLDSVDLGIIRDEALHPSAP